MKPVCTVETYTGATLDHTFSNECEAVYFRNSLNDSIGTFQVTIPSRSAYSDIALYDKVKIYLGYDTVPTSATFVGYVEEISSTVGADGGYLKTLSGMDLGEILLRRITENKYWQSTEMSTITNELASTDLGLGIDKDNTVGKSATFQVDGETYFDILRRISDYWISAGSNVQRDFYCATDGDLQWKSRPIRTTGVSTITEKENVEDYKVYKSLENVRNWIKVYGTYDKTKTLALTPTDENWTDTDSDSAWSAVTGTLSFPVAAPAPDEGTRYVRCDSANGGDGFFYVSFGRTFSPEHPVHIDGRINQTKNYSYDNVEFAVYSTAITSKRVYMLAPNLANSWYQSFDSNPLAWTDNTWDLESGVAGGNWSTTLGSPEWENVRGIWFWVKYAGEPSYCCIDDMGLRGGRFYSVAQDSTSQTNYGRRDMVTVDNSLNTQTATSERALSLLYQLKDPPTQIDLTLKGDTNILVGDQLSITLATEGISAATYYVQTAEQFFTKNPLRFATKANLMNTVNTRRPPYSNQISVISNIKRSINAMGADARGVRQ